MTVVTALELEDHVPLRRRPREAERSHRGFGSRIDESHHLDRGHAAAHELSELEWRTLTRLNAYWMEALEKAAADELIWIPHRFFMAPRRVIAKAAHAVVAVTSGIRSFTTTPYVFTTLDRARAFTGTAANKATYFLVRVAPGADVESVRRRLKANLSDVDVLTAAPAAFHFR